jgi:hypothetical protein
MYTLCTRGQKIRAGRRSQFKSRRCVQIIICEMAATRLCKIDKMGIVYVFDAEMNEFSQKCLLQSINKVILLWFEVHTTFFCRN